MRVLATAGLLVAGVAVAGCGPSGSGAAASASTDDKQEAARLKLSQCLREQGVDVPDGPRAGGANQRVQLSAAERKKLQTAMQGPCKTYRAQAFGNITAEQRQEFQDALTKFSACMRQHGVDLPDPVAGGGGGPRSGARRIDDGDPKTKAAMTACRDKLPRNGPGGGAGIRIGAGGGGAQ